MAATGKTAANVERAIARSGRRRISTEEADPTSQVIEQAISDRFAQRAARNAKVAGPKRDNDTRDRWDKVFDALAPKPEPEPVPALNSKQLLENAIAGASRATVNGTREGTVSVAELLRSAIESRQDFSG